MTDFMAASEAAQRLGVSVARVYQLAREERLPHVRRGRRLLIPRAAWETWLAMRCEEALRSTHAPGAANPHERERA
jgi:excisionase family DNA binding protein